MPSRTTSRVSDDPLLLSEWDNEKNTGSPDEVSLGSAKRCRWICSRCGFRWETPVYSRGSNGRGCPECAKAARGMTKSKSSALRNALTLQFPEAAREWDTQKNMPLRAEETPSFSNRRVWWVCANCQNEWQATVNHRTTGRTGCPICSKTLGGISKSQAAAKANNFSAQYPEIAAEWHPTKNAPLLPEDVSAKCNKKVWWLCRKYKHSWQASVGDRTRGGKETSCPFCRNKRILVGFNDLATTHPDICREWDYAKNGDLKPEEVSFGAEKKVWWICAACGHEWQAFVYTRTKGHGCPVCSRRHISL